MLASCGMLVACATDALHVPPTRLLRRPPSLTLPLAGARHPGTPHRRAHVLRQRAQHPRRHPHEGGCKPLRCCSSACGLATSSWVADRPWSLPLPPVTARACPPANQPRLLSCGVSSLAQPGIPRLTTRRRLTTRSWMASRWLSWCWTLRQWETSTARPSGCWCAWGRTGHGISYLPGMRVPLDLALPPLRARSPWPSPMMPRARVPPPSAGQLCGRSAGRGHPPDPGEPQQARAHPAQAREARRAGEAGCGCGCGCAWSDALWAGWLDRTRGA